MGIIIGKFRKKKSTYEVLEKLEGQITAIEQFGKNTEQAQKKIVGRFLVLAFLVYFLLAFVLYFYFYQVSTNEKLYCLGSLIALPFVIWIIKRILTWYYSRKIKRNQKKLVTLKEEKKKMLDNVMETETYKVAKKILEKFGNESEKKISASSELTPAKSSMSLVPSSVRTAASATTGLRQRYVGPMTARSRVSFGGTMSPQSHTPTTATATKLGTALRNVGPYSAMPATPLLLPRGILPRDRSVLDKMVDYLVGDGPSNRFALICKQCSSHNGMALKEEFEYLSFKCCYCSTFNPARKKKPMAPKLEFNSSVLSQRTDDTSESEKHSSSENESEVSKPVITELRDSPDIGKMSDFDKLSDLELKSSDNESLPMEVDLSLNQEPTTADQSLKQEDTNSDATTLEESTATKD